MAGASRDRSDTGRPSLGAPPPSGKPLRPQRSPPGAQPPAVPRRGGAATSTERTTIVRSSRLSPPCGSPSRSRASTSKATSWTRSSSIRGCAGARVISGRRSTATSCHSSRRVPSRPSSAVTRTTASATASTGWSTFPRTPTNSTIAARSRRRERIGTASLRSSTHSGVASPRSCRAARCRRGCRARESAFR